MDPFHHSPPKDQAVIRVPDQLVFVCGSCRLPNSPISRQEFLCIHSEDPSHKCSQKHAVKQRAAESKPPRAEGLPSFAMFNRNPKKTQKSHLMPRVYDARLALLTSRFLC